MIAPPFVAALLLHCRFVIGFRFKNMDFFYYIIDYIFEVFCVWYVGANLVKVCATFWYVGATLLFIWVTF